jgi:hypothetical protein
VAQVDRHPELLAVVTEAFDTLRELGWKLGHELRLGQSRLGARVGTRTNDEYCKHAKE